MSTSKPLGANARTAIAAAIVAAIARTSRGLKIAAIAGMPLHGGGV